MISTVYIIVVTKLLYVRTLINICILIECTAGKCDPINTCILVAGMHVLLPKPTQCIRVL